MIELNFRSFKGMSSTKTIQIQLSAEDSDRLEAEAHRRNLAKVSRSKLTTLFITF
jgi:hypothetical protein